MWSGKADLDGLELTLTGSNVLQWCRQKELDRQKAKEDKLEWFQEDVKSFRLSQEDEQVHNKWMFKIKGVTT